MAAAVCAAPPPSTSATTTAAAAWSARARQSARPMPLAPPVTTATFPLMSISVAPCRCSRGVVGPRGEIGVCGEQAGILLAGLFGLGRNVLGRPQAGLRLIALEHVAGHGDLVHL